LVAIAQGRGTTDPTLAAIFIAQRINRQMGGAVVAPWELGQLTEDWTDAFWGLERRLPNMQNAVSEIEKRKAEIRAGHPALKRR
jgi:hypothetical protein